MADRGYRGRPQRGERADRQVNAGHSRGLDAALSDTEAKIRKLKTERIYAFDQNGKEISHSTRGTSTSTKLPSSDYTHGRMSREQLSIVWDRADVVSTNKALREVAKELGWDYTRKRTS